jgi:MerR family transcriptional regulator/heat shock protein HspR
VTRQEIIYMSNEDSKAIYFISVASTLSGIHQQTIRTYEQKGLIKPFRTGGGTRRYSQEDVDRLIQIQNLSQRGINLDGIKIIYEMKEKIEELQRKIISLESEISNQKTESKTKEKEIHQSYKNEIVKKTEKTIRRKF